MHSERKFACCSDVCALQLMQLHASSSYNAPLKSALQAAIASPQHPMWLVRAKNAAVLFYAALLLMSS
jgi:hypothetical protein